jgi:hypothetical protein
VNVPGVLDVGGVIVAGPSPNVAETPLKSPSVGVALAIVTVIVVETAA